MPRRIISAESARRFGNQLVGTNYKLVLIEDENKPSPGLEDGHRTTPNQPTAAQERVPFKFNYCKRPAGTVGKRTFQLMAVLGMISDEYHAMARFVEDVLRRSPGIDMHLTITNQKNRRDVEAVKLRIASMLPEWKVFEDDDYWPIEAFIYKALKSSKEKYNRLDKKLKLARDKAQVHDDVKTGAKIVERQHQIAQARGRAGAKARAQAKCRAQEQQVQEAESAQESAQGSAQESDQVQTQTQAATEPGSEAQTATNESHLEEPNSNASDDPDNIAGEVVLDLSNMSLCNDFDGDTSMADGDIGGSILPEELTNHPPPSWLPAPVAPAPPEVPLSNPGASKTEQKIAALQRTFKRLAALSPKQRDNLPPDIQLYLAMLDSRSRPSSLQPTGNMPGVSAPTPAPTAPTSTPAPTVPTPAPAPTVPAPAPTPIPTPTPPLPLASGSTSVAAPALPSNDRPRPKMRPLPLPSPPPIPEPKGTYTTSPVTGDALMLVESTPALSASSNATARSHATVGSRPSSKFMTIDQLEPGPTTIQVDDENDDDIHNIDSSLADISSVPESGQDSQPKANTSKVTSKQTKTANRAASTMVESVEGSVVARGQVRAQEENAGKKTGTSKDKAGGRGRGRGRGNGRGGGRGAGRGAGRGQSSQGNDVEPVPPPTGSTTGRLTRSQANV